MYQTYGTKPLEALEIDIILNFQIWGKSLFCTSVSASICLFSEDGSANAADLSCNDILGQSGWRTKVLVVKKGKFSNLIW